MINGQNTQQPSNYGTVQQQHNVPNTHRIVHNGVVKNNQHGSGTKVYRSDRKRTLGSTDLSSDDTLTFDPEGIDLININQSMNESVVME